MKTTVMLVETAILAFILGGAFVLYTQDKEKEREAAKETAEENPEA